MKLLYLFGLFIGHICKLHLLPVSLKSSGQHQCFPASSLRSCVIAWACLSLEPSALTPAALPQNLDPPPTPGESVRRSYFSRTLSCKVVPGGLPTAPGFFLLLRPAETPWVVMDTFEAELSMAFLLSRTSRVKGPFPSLFILHYKKRWRRRCFSIAPQTWLYRQHRRKPLTAES